MRMLHVVALLSAQFVAARPATAVVVKNVTTDTVLFADDFEGLSAVSLAPAVDPTDDYDPIAVTGTWNVYESDEEAGALAEIQVTNSASSPDPGPYSGSSYLRIFRDLNIPLTAHDLNGVLTADQTTTGDVIRMSTMVYVPNDGNNARGQFFMVGTPGDVSSARAWVRPNGAGDVIAVGPDFALTDTGLDYTPDVWQQWDMEYEVGSSTFSVTVNGVSAGGFPSFAAGNVAALLFINGNNTAGSIYFDSVETIPRLMPDLNMDGVVDIFDVNIVSDNWGGTGPAGDANKDGIVDIFDVNVISDNWTTTGGAAAVPEPAGIVLMALACVAVALRHARGWHR